MLSMGIRLRSERSKVIWLQNDYLFWSHSLKSSVIWFLMLVQTDLIINISSPVLVQICCSNRVPKWRRQLLPPENVLWHQAVHVILLQQQHCPCVIGPGCTRHEGELPEVHYPHGWVHWKPWWGRRRRAGWRKRKGQGLVSTVGSLAHLLSV